MKTIAIFVMLFALSAPQLLAQNLIPQAATIEHNDEKRPCLQVTVDPPPKILKEAWRDYLKDEHDFKLKGIGFLANKDLLSAEKVVVKAISPKEMNFYTHIVEGKNSTVMKVFAAFGYDIYIDKKQQPKEYAALRSILEDFLKTYLPKYYEESIEETEDRLEELTDERDEIEDTIKDDEKAIKKLEKEIKDLQKNLKSNESKLEAVEEELKATEGRLKRVRKQLDKM